MDSKKVLEIFKEITTVPRESGHEEKIIKWLLDFGKKHKLGAKKDKVGNVLLTKKADKGMEKVPAIIMQSHCDMVCERGASGDPNSARHGLYAHGCDVFRRPLRKFRQSLHGSRTDDFLGSHRRAV